MSYPLPTNVTGWTGLASYANTVTGGSFWLFFLGALCIVVMFISYKASGNNVNMAFAASSWAFFFTSIFLNILGLVGGKFILYGALCAAIGLFVLSMSRDHY